MYNKKGMSNMLHNRLLLSAILLLGLGFAGLLQAQESINATGGNASGSGGSSSYSIGQVVYTTNTAINGSLTHGAQQPFEISVITTLEVAYDKNYKVSVYPNPTNDYLIMEMKSSRLSNLHYQLYEINGKLLQNEKVTSNQTRIDMSNLVPATYILKLLIITQDIASQREVKSFKINKK